MKQLENLSSEQTYQEIRNHKALIVQFSIKGCSVSEVFEDFLCKYRDERGDTRVFKTDLDSASKSDYLEFTRDFLFSPTYVAFLGGAMIGHANVASTEAFDSFFQIPVKK